LKQTWPLLKKTIAEPFEALVELMNPASSFKKLRGAIEEGGGNVLPYMGMYLTDLVFLEDGNPDFVAEKRKEGEPPPVVTENKEPIINFNKHYMIYRQISSFRKFQQDANFREIEKEDPIYTFLYELPTLSEEELYALSLDREPRENQTS